MTLYVPAKEFEGELWVRASDFQKAVSEAEGRSIAEAEQPAQQDGPINDGWQITVAHGHSGYGVYAHMEDYPEEGAVLVQVIEQQEPVAVVSGYYGGQCVILPTNPARIFNSGTALYTTPPKRKWQGLTDDEIESCNNTTTDWGKPCVWLWDDDFEEGGLQFARAIEAKLKEKNT